MTSSKRAPKYMRQHVTVTGLGSPTFQNAISNLEDVYLAFKHVLPRGGLEPWEPTRFSQNKAIEANTRYFTERKLAPNEAEMEFFPFVDKYNELANAKSDAFFHGPDNRVEYYALTSAEGGGKQK